MASGGGNVVSNDGGSVVSNDGGSFTGASLSSQVHAGLQSLSPQSTQNPLPNRLRTIQGDFTQTTSGTLALSIAGTNFSNAGPKEYDRLGVTGTATLSGLLAFAFLDPQDPTNNATPFQPAAGAQFDVVVASRVVTTNLLFRGPIWGDGLTLLARTVDLPDGSQALRLTATPLPPSLAIQKSGAIYQVLYPANYLGFTLQHSTNLGGTWDNLTSGTNRVLLAPDRPDGFYRLRK